MSPVVLPTNAQSGAESVSKSAWASTSLSVLPAVSTFICASVEATVTTSDAVFRAVSVLPTFPAFTSVSQRVGQSRSLHIAPYGALFLGLYLCKAMMQRLNQSLNLHISQYLAKTIRPKSMLACRPVRSTEPWHLLGHVCHQVSRPLSFTIVLYTFSPSVSAFISLSV